MIVQTCVLDATEALEPARVGAKAANQARLRAAGLAVPPFVVVAERSPDMPEQLEPYLARLARGGGTLAVRSSSPEEDGALNSFAGLLESHLGVAVDDVCAAIEKVQQSALAARVSEYRRGRGLTGAAPVPAVIVQTMLRPSVSGVAFGADPVTGDADVCVISAVAGCAEPLVDGAADGQTWRIDVHGHVIARPAESNDDALLSDAQLRAIGDATRQAGGLLGSPQDVEWAIEEGKLWLVQSRPITSLAPAGPPTDGLRRVWDNANISESYGGITTPLTFSFAQSAYEGVYRAFCQLMGVPRHRVEANHDLFGRMLGLFRGRVVLQPVQLVSADRDAAGLHVEPRLHGTDDGRPRADARRDRPQPDPSGLARATARPHAVRRQCRHVDVAVPDASPHDASLRSQAGGNARAFQRSDSGHEPQRTGSGVSSARTGAAHAMGRAAHQRLLHHDLLRPAPPLGAAVGRRARVGPGGPVARRGCGHDQRRTGAADRRDGALRRDDRPGRRSVVRGGPGAGA